MVKFNCGKIREQAEKDFEATWLETASLLKQKGRIMNWIKTEGKPHPVTDLNIKMREIFLSLGFEELINQSILDQSEVYRQYGPEAPVILDRCFYLAELPRPDLGISSETLAKIKRKIPEFAEDRTEKLQRLFREYKEGKIEGDNFIEEMVSRLDLKSEQATAILRFFPEFLKLCPSPSNLILRSHMTALWFSGLSALQKKQSPPMKLFSIGLKFRREQQLDPLHLYESHVASAVVMAEDLSLEDGTELSKTVLSQLGFKDARFTVKKATSKYYAPDSEMEIFVNADGQWIEVGDQGLYSPVALANYDIPYPVFNVGFGVERLAMLHSGETDIRRLVYPQFYKAAEYSDKQIAGMIELIEKPETAEGQKIAEAIIETAWKHAEQNGPCKFLAYSGEAAGKMVKVYVFEPDSNVKLMGPAALNVIYVYQGNILGVPEKGLDDVPLVKEAREKGISTGLRYLDTVASMAAARIEQKALEDIWGEVIVRIKIAKLPSDVNIKIPQTVEQYISGQNKKIIVKGPTFIGIKAEFT